MYCTEKIKSQDGILMIFPMSLSSFAESTPAPLPSNQTTLPSLLLVVETKSASKQQLSRANPRMPSGGGGSDPLFMAHADYPSFTS